MAVIKRISKKDKSYDLTGTSLKELCLEIKKKGPVVDGARRSARTGYGIKVVAAKSESVEIPSKDDKNKLVKFTTKGVIVNWIAFCELPQIPKKTYQNFSQMDKKIWDRFMKAVIAHERKHVEITKALAEEIGAEFQALTSLGEGKDTAAARKIGQKNWIKASAKFKESPVTERLKKSQKAFDGKTSHGGRATNLCNLISTR